MLNPEHTPKYSIHQPAAPPGVGEEREDALSVYHIRLLIFWFLYPRHLLNSCIQQLAINLQQQRHPSFIRRKLLFLLLSHVLYHLHMLLTGGVHIRSHPNPPHHPRWPYTRPHPRAPNSRTPVHSIRHPIHMVPGRSGDHRVHIHSIHPARAAHPID